MILTLPFDRQITSILERISKPRIPFDRTSLIALNKFSNKLSSHFPRLFQIYLNIENISSLSYLVFSRWYALISNRCPFPSSRGLSMFDRHKYQFSQFDFFEEEGGKTTVVQVLSSGKNFPVLSCGRRNSFDPSPPPAPFPLCNFICLLKRSNDGWIKRGEETIP